MSVAASYFASSERESNACSCRSLLRLRYRWRLPLNVWQMQCKRLPPLPVIALMLVSSEHRYHCCPSGSSSAGSVPLRRKVAGDALSHLRLRAAYGAAQGAMCGTASPRDAAPLPSSGCWCRERRGCCGMVPAARSCCAARQRRECCSCRTALLRG